MKQLFKYAIMACAAVACTLPLTSCDKDPEPDPKPVTPIDPDPVDTKAQLSSLDIKGLLYMPDTEIRFNYDSENRISTIKEITQQTNKLAHFRWDPFTLTYEGREFVTTLSQKGYITSAYTKDFPEEVTTFEYDNSGHLIKMVKIYNDENDDGYDNSFQEEVYFTWKDGLLSEAISSFRDADELFGAEAEAWEVSYGNIDNVSGIWPIGFWASDAIAFSFNYRSNKDFQFPYIFHTGLLGAAPTKLPVKIEYVGWGSYEMSYILNDKGYIAQEFIKETWDGSVHNSEITYTYR